MDHSSVPSAVYSDIKVSSVGLTEDSAISNGMEYKVCKHFFKTNGRSVANNETEGFIKIIVDKKSRKLIGAHVIGAGADELINELALIKRSGLTVDDVKETVHAHPTVSEAISEVCKLA
jgi:dihydrolipoamide dehydrogenase